MKYQLIVKYIAHEPTYSVSTVKHEFATIKEVKQDLKEYASELKQQGFTIHELGDLLAKYITPYMATTKMVAKHENRMGVTLINFSIIKL